jgi:hypothetical protein
MDLSEFEVARSLGTQAREHMVNCNIRLVMSIAKKYLGRGMDLQVRRHRRRCAGSSHGAGRGSGWQCMVLSLAGKCRKCTVLAGV